MNVVPHCVVRNCCQNPTQCLTNSNLDRSGAIVKSLEMSALNDSEDLIRMEDFDGISEVLVK